MGGGRGVGRVGVRLGRSGRIDAKLLPVVRHAKRADRLGGRTADDLTGSCAPTTVDLGSWCLDASTQPLTNDEVGKNDYLFATQRCVELGGYLPTAAQLIGAVQHVKLSSTIDDDQLTALIDIDPTDGLKDKREMTAARSRSASRRRSAAPTARSRAPPASGGIGLRAPLGRLLMVLQPPHDIY